jgi:hypothetical protein
MTKLNVTFVSFAAVLFSTAVFSAQPNVVQGEKLDSGLGGLSPGYTAAEFQRSASAGGYRVPGESLDSGLGGLSPSYTAAEFQRGRELAGYHVVGEKLDSGLGELTYQRNDIVASNKQ